MQNWPKPILISVIWTKKLAHAWLIWEGFSLTDMKESARSLSTEGVQETRTTSEPWESVKARVEGKKLCVEIVKANEALTYQQVTKKM